MKAVAVSIAVFLLIVGLIKISSMDSANSGIEDRGAYGTVCLNGVIYYDGHNTLAPAFNIDGTLIACSNK